MSDESRMQTTARMAMQAYWATVTYPVLWAGGDRLISLGSCVLFRHSDRHFLLTALHLFEEYDEKTHIRFPYEGLIGPLGKRDESPAEFGTIFVHTVGGKEADEANKLDIVAIELFEKSLLAGKKQHWSFITSTNSRYLARIRRTLFPASQKSARRSLAKLSARLCCFFRLKRPIMYQRP
ncbi:hypothetical protein ACQR1I_04860 [Bradyrhizobium sp. HKCCYLS2038]|uniref:hypothetical protein n=1 Tax=unclassified Bradyrhizobium TaxID=2631580 RepID=UPI003EBE7E05